VAEGLKIKTGIIQSEDYKMERTTKIIIAIGVIAILGITVYAFRDKIFGKTQSSRVVNRGVTKEAKQNTVKFVKE